MKHRTVMLAVSAVVAVSVSGCISVGLPGPGELETVVVEESPRWLEPNRVAIVDVEGVISFGEGSLLAGPHATVAGVRGKLDRAAEDGSVRAVVLRINSPGGEVGASDALYREVRRFREETGRPVVACLMSIATSGAYYTALGADSIVAAPTSVTGSVGVITRWLNVEGLLDKLGLRPQVFKSGEKKDIGSPTRIMTPEEKEILDGVTRQMFERFLETVRRNRPQMGEQELKFISDGRIVTAEEALQLKMVDRLGYLEDALSEAKQLAGIKAADVILYRAAPHYNANIYARGSDRADVLAEAAAELLRWRDPAFLYLWCPGL